MTLTEDERDVAWARARAQVKSQSRPDVFTHKGDKTRNVANEHGARLALTKALGDPIPNRVEVRHTAHPVGNLLVRNDHESTAAHVLVRGVIADGKYEVAGYIWGFEAKRPDHWDRSLRYPAYRWRPDELHDLRTLAAALKIADAEQLEFDLGGVQ